MNFLLNYKVYKDSIKNFKSFFKVNLMNNKFLVVFYLVLFMTPRELMFYVIKQDIYLGLMFIFFQKLN